MAADAAMLKSLFDDYDLLTEELGGNPSGLTALNRSFHKHLLVAAASSLEFSVKELIPKLFGEYGNEPIKNFIDKNIFSRSYHTLFDWKQKSAAGFFKGFGDDCAKAFKDRLKGEDFSNQHQAFMEIGNYRNEIVHKDYAQYSLNLTPREIFEKYELATQFISQMESIVVGQFKGDGVDMDASS